MKKRCFFTAAGLIIIVLFSLPSHCAGVEICFKKRMIMPLKANEAELTDNEIKLIYSLSEIEKIIPHLGTKEYPGTEGVKIIFKERSRKPIMTKAAAIKVVEITGWEMRLIYPLDEVASINGITDLNRTKLMELEELGHQYANEKKYDEAIELFNKLIELDPSNSRMITDMARALCAVERSPEAVPYILKEIEINPRSWEAYKRLGSAYRHLKEKDPIAAYKKVVELQGGPNPVNMFDLGLTYYAVFKKYDEALPYFQKAVTLDPGSKEVKWFFYTHLGDCYLFLGKYQEAMDAFQAVIDKFPAEEDDKKAHYKAYIGQSKAYDGLGQSEKAEEFRSKAKETGFRSS
ncbi:MAG: tetratricopeptide repeat protein [Candidatus Omnitrophota bacterium]